MSMQVWYTATAVLGGLFVVFALGLIVYMIIGSRNEKKAVINLSNSVLNPKSDEKVVEESAFTNEPRNIFSRKNKKRLPELENTEENEQRVERAKEYSRSAPLARPTLAVPVDTAPLSSFTAKPLSKQVSSIPTTPNPPRSRRELRAIPQRSANTRPEYKEVAGNPFFSGSDEVDLPDSGKD